MIKKIFLLISITCSTASIIASGATEFTPDETSTTATPQEKKQLKDRLLPFSNIAIKDINTEKLLHYLVFFPQRAIDYSAWRFFDTKTVLPEQQESLSYTEYFEKIGAGKMRKAVQPITSIGATCIAWYFFYRPALQKILVPKKIKLKPYFTAKDIEDLKKRLKKQREKIEEITKECKEKENTITTMVTKKRSGEELDGLLNKLQSIEQERTKAISELTSAVQELLEQKQEVVRLEKKISQLETQAKTEKFELQAKYDELSTQYNTDKNKNMKDEALADMYSKAYTARNEECEALKKKMNNLETAIFGQKCRIESLETDLKKLCIGKHKKNPSL